MPKPADTKEFMAQQAPDYKRGWEDCVRAVSFYLEHEGTGKPRLTTYCAAMADAHHYLFEGYGNISYPNEEHQNGLEEKWEWMLEEDGVIELRKE